MIPSREWTHFQPLCQVLQSWSESSLAFSIHICRFQLPPSFPSVWTYWTVPTMGHQATSILMLMWPYYPWAFTLLVTLLSCLLLHLISIHFTHIIILVPLSSSTYNSKCTWNLYSWVNLSCIDTVILHCHSEPTCNCPSFGSLGVSIWGHIGVWQCMTVRRWGGVRRWGQA